MLRFLQFTFQELQRLKNRTDFGVKKRLQQANFMRLSAKSGSEVLTQQDVKLLHKE